MKASSNHLHTYIHVASTYIYTNSISYAAISLVIPLASLIFTSQIPDIYIYVPIARSNNAKTSSKIPLLTYNSRKTPYATLASHYSPIPTYDTLIYGVRYRIVRVAMLL